MKTNVIRMETSPVTRLTKQNRLLIKEVDGLRLKILVLENENARLCQKLIQQTEANGGAK